MQETSMAVSLFTFVDLYSRVLHSADHIVNKGVEFAKANKVSEKDMLNWRLIDDMMPLSFQLSVVANFTRQWPARVLGLEVPADISPDLDIAGYKAAFAESQEFLARLTAQQFAGRDDIPLTVTIGNGMSPTLPAAQWLTVFATTNIYFHLSTAYGILRSRGVPIGKIDLFAGRL
jgi:hypothetical protein